MLALVHHSKKYEQRLMINGKEITPQLQEELRLVKTKRKEETKRRRGISRPVNSSVPPYTSCLCSRFHVAFSFIQYVCLYVCLWFYPSVHLSVCLPVCLHVCSPVCLSASLCVCTLCLFFSILVSILNLLTRHYNYDKCLSLVHLWGVN